MFFVPGINKSTTETMLDVKDDEEFEVGSLTIAN